MLGVFNFQAIIPFKDRKEEEVQAQENQS